MSTSTQSVLIFEDNGLYGVKYCVDGVTVGARVKCCKCHTLVDQVVNNGPPITNATFWCRDLDALFGLAGNDDNVPICKGLGK